MSAWYRAGERPADIAQRLDVSTAAIYRELKRGEVLNDDGSPLLDYNQRRVYNPVLAQQRVKENFKRRGKPAATGTKEGGLDSDTV